MLRDDNLNFAHARTDEQQKLMEKIQRDGVCPFCWKHFEYYHPKPIEEKTDWWIVTENMNPYDGASLHLLFVYKEHVISPTDISTEGWTDLHTTIKSALKRHGKDFGAFFMRFGETNSTGSSVAHLHAHVIVGRKYSESTGDKIKVKLGYK